MDPLVYPSLVKNFPDLKISQNLPLAPLTTLKIGGPAEIFVQTTTPGQFESMLNFVYQNRLSPVTILGNASNVLISDSGLPGLVIKNSSLDIKILGDPKGAGNVFFRPQSSDRIPTHQISTHRTENEPNKYLNFAILDYDESDSPPVRVEISSGTPLPYTINNLLAQGITGLQWFAYIPGTFGGAVWYNTHGGSYHLSDFIESVKAFNLQTGQIENLLKSDLSWDYEHSHFQQNPHLIILSAVLRLFRGDVSRAKATAAAWMQQKAKIQPMNSAGSVFQNPPLDVCLKIWGEQKSTGWIIDHELNFKGKSIGGAKISDKHANFIVNNGHATAKDYLALARLVQSVVQKRFGFDLQMEVKLLGKFD